MTTLQLVVMVLGCLAAVAYGLDSQIRLHEDAGLDVFELIEKYGFQSERHSVTTEDGYILEMHRIPHGRNNTKANKGVVLLMHGLLSSSADFVNFGENSLGFILADIGYDVWMGNARGTTNSRKHVTLSPDEDKEQFWAFSWNEIGMYDLPAKIDYILATTGKEKIQFIGHSQGTTAFFVMGTERPEYNAKIRLMNALGPIAYMSNMANPFFKLLAQFEHSIEFLLEYVGLYEFLPNNDLIPLIAAQACDEGAPFEELCTNFLFLICGYDSEQLNATMIPVIATNAPAGSSTRQLLHYAQEIKNGYFRKYDFNSEEENIIEYGQPTPPNYDISKMTAPIAFHYGKNDWLAAVSDVKSFIRQVPNSVYDNEIDFAAFNHIDFLWANDVVDLLYNDLIDVMEKY